MKLLRGILAVVIILTGQAFPADATKPTKQEQEAFRLSMNKINATMQAYRNLFELLGSDPALLQLYKAETTRLEDEDTNGRDKLSLIAARLQSKDARFAQVFLKAGITPKEAGMTIETVVGSLLGLAMLESSKGTTASLPKGFVADNVEFVKAHKDQITAAFSQMQDLAKKYPALADSDKDDEDDDEDEK